MVPDIAVKVFLLQHGLSAPSVAGEDLTGFKLYPIFEQLDLQNPNQNVRIHADILFKPLKELKFACSTYGQNLPFLHSLIEAVCNEALPLNDWITLAKVCLLGGEYLLRKSRWVEFCTEQAETNRTHGVPIMLEMLTGVGPFATWSNN